MEYCDQIENVEYCDQIENVELYFYKRILGLGSHTSHTAVTGELGVYPLTLIYYKRCVKYWLKIFFNVW